MVPAHGRIRASTGSFTRHVRRRRCAAVLAAALAVIASCGAPEAAAVDADAVLDALVSASTCELALLESVVELGGRAPLAEDEPLFSPIYHAAGWDMGDVRSTREEPVDPLGVARASLAQVRENAAPGARRAPLFLRDQITGLEMEQAGREVSGRVVLLLGERYRVDCVFQLKVVAGRLEPVRIGMPHSGFAITRQVGGRFRPEKVAPEAAR